MKGVQILVIGLCLLPSVYIAPINAKTSMDSVVKDLPPPCSSELIQLAEVALKTNPHRILSYTDKSTDIHLFNALAVTSYRDRDSHITFHGVKNTAGGCDTSVTESYVLQTSCSDARHEAFSKWRFQGKLNNRTYVLNSKRIKGKQAILTDQLPDICLVTTRQVINNK
ncbi:hypothetical protein VXS05_01025 [Photobacterium toruni]|uniref:Uncharacterized protein n=1 Tax=Photobacterium toruni TaxID=1935446 RepID=A0A1T4R1H1_9GAMM|nr:hypothetical protein [Photobacterium toruni]MEC6813664.1 hypothetical protein [Photobacterium toruni]MEC6830528.1 hypothetical protein [Photobacterium toruni]SKA09830.1 hypothetical protein CZ814_01156 [Photobacterium toruni]